MVGKQESSLSRLVTQAKHQSTILYTIYAMVYNLSYRRPQRQPRSSNESVNGERKQLSIQESVRSGSSGMSHGIPEALSFDRIIAGGVCPVSATISVPRVSRCRCGRPDCRAMLTTYSPAQSVTS